MKLSKSSTVLLNIVLILLMILLVKSLISAPKNLSAKGKLEYMVVEVRGTQKQQNAIDEHVAVGWKFHSAWSARLYFEREK